ncbi:hypothetical protein ANCDUO_06110 [Ancylostoma duodenale]|uniref:Mariner Mos1 transposase n=1 Tax=Ancylostoma duodenale TaxID=51022 RepID=A0A0C2DLU1_9BILA|nr:hypothetical protein ANCDUO_06110 [Ancylostoma duodenale]
MYGGAFLTHVVKAVKEALEALCWDLPPHAAYSSDYQLLRSMSHRLFEQGFQSFEDVEKWVKEWIESEDEVFYRCSVRLLPERWGKGKSLRKGRVDGINGLDSFRMWEKSRAKGVFRR